MNGGVGRGAGRLCAQPQCSAGAEQGSDQGGALDAPLRTPATFIAKCRSASRPRRTVEVVRTVETGLRHSSSPPLDCPGSAGPHDGAAGEHRGIAEALPRHGMRLAQCVSTRVKVARYRYRYRWGVKMG